jgi:hypothetical protein
MLAKGFCRKHYLRNHRYGDVNIVHKPSEYVPTGAASPKFKHGKWDHPLYGTWSNIMDRCYNQKCKAYPQYGGVGIDVCERWHDISNFIVDMGQKKTGESIDRIDGSKGYSPENCRWANSTVQSRNRQFVKLTLEKAENIRKMRAGGVSRKNIAAFFSVSEATIKKVISGAYWRPNADKVLPAHCESNETTRSSC